MIHDHQFESTDPCDLCVQGDCHCLPGARLSIGGRVALLLLGGCATGLAILGLMLPLLPTTPFALIAVWAFARASPRLENRLRSHPRLGPLLEDWRQRRAIPRRAKQLAVLSLTVSWLSLVILGLSVMALAGAGAVMLAVGTWILSQKE